MKLGVDIGGNHICIAVIDNEKIIEKFEKQTNTVDIIEFIRENTNIYMAKYNIDLLGIGYCGIVENNIIKLAPNLNIREKDIVSELKNYINLKILLRNDADCAGLAEKHYGVMKNYSDSVLLTIGTGIGGAYFHAEKQINPKKNSAFEFGHMIIEKNGLKCNCGKLGCFEQYASITALKRKVKKFLNISDEITGEELKELIENNIFTLDKVLNEYTEDLCIGLSNIISILAPEIIVLGGSFAHYEEMFLDRIINKLKEYVENIPEIKMAELKNDAGLIGATIFE